MEILNRDNYHFEYEPMSESVIETITGETVYRENGIGEVDLRDVMRGEVTWENSTDPFTFDDFCSEIIFPDLESKDAFAERSGETWKARTETSPTMQEILNLDMDEVVDFVMRANDIGIDDDDYIFDEEGGYFTDADEVIDEYRRGHEE